MYIIITTKPGAHTTKYNHQGQPTNRVRTNRVHIWPAQDRKYTHLILDWFDLDQTIAYCYWTDRGKGEFQNQLLSYIVGAADP